MKKITAEIIEAIQNSTAVLVCGHIRPDGDCVGSALAMRAICEKLGKIADAVCDVEEVPSFDFLPDYSLFCKPRYDNYDLFIAVDCANEKRLGCYFKQKHDADAVIVIDHHPTDAGYGDINYIDESACSTCSIVYELFEGTDLLDKKIATMLYTGISTDTGHFMHANTDARVFRTAEKLCGFGIDVGALNHAIYCGKSKERMRLTARALEKMTFFENGKIALICISLSDIKECGAKSEDTEGLIDYASSVAGVLISMAMCEQEGGLYRVSLRSVSADVSAVASTFGGGGHKLAAGCILSGTGDEVAKKLVAAAAVALV